MKFTLASLTTCLILVGSGCQARKAAHPGALILETPNADNDFIAVAAEILQGEERAATRVATQNKILIAWGLLEGPIDIVLVAHGQDSAFAMGTGFAITQVPPAAAKSVYNNNADTVAFGQALRGKIATIFLFGCEVAMRKNPLQTDHLFPSLSEGLSNLDVDAKVKGYDREVVANRARPGRRAAYFSVDRAAPVRTSNNGAWVPS